MLFCSSEFNFTTVPCVVILNKYDELMSPISKEISYETKLRVIQSCISFINQSSRAGQCAATRDMTSISLFRAGR